MPKYWLMKSEPATFSIDDLARVKVEPWTGVRSVFARFHMRAMSVGDDVLFYHSSCEPPGVAGLARVARTGVVDETQFDPASPYFDPKATRERPIWDCVDVAFVEKFPYLVSLPHIKADPELANMMLLRIGRLSVMPVEAAEFSRIVKLGHVAPPPLPAMPRPARMPKPKPAKAAQTAQTAQNARAGTTKRAAKTARKKPAAAQRRKR
jgi:predicted RNA-binding protein with PUA-like domain